MTLNPFLCIDLSISDSLRSVRKSVLIYETIILGAKIKEYRKKENITQEQLAEMADISLSHMSNVETASVSVSLPALKLIADALGVTIDELLVDSYSKKQKKYFYSKKMDLIMEQCETVEQEIIVNTVSTLADNLLKSRKKEGV